MSFLATDVLVSDQPISLDSPSCFQKGDRYPDQGLCRFFNPCPARALQSPPKDGINPPLFSRSRKLDIWGYDVIWGADPPPPPPGAPQAKKIVFLTSKLPISKGKTAHLALVIIKIFPGAAPPDPPIHTKKIVFSRFSKTWFGNSFYFQRLAKPSK